MGQKQETVSFRVTVPVPVDMTLTELANHIRGELRGSCGHYMPGDERQHILKTATVAPVEDASLIRDIVAEICGFFDVLASDNEALASRGYSAKKNKARAEMWREAAKTVRTLEWRP